MTWTDPDPFLSPASSPVSYCGIYFEEIQREVNDQCSALGITTPTWYRYLSAAGRENITSAVEGDASGESLVGYDYSWKPYITDIRDVYEGTAGATGLFSAWGITEQEYLEVKYTAPYSSWIHSAGALSEDGDLYDRDLGELRSYVNASALYAENQGFVFDNTDDGEGDFVRANSANAGLRIGDQDPVDRSHRGISIFKIADMPEFIAAILCYDHSVYVGDPWGKLGNLKIGYFCPNGATVLTNFYEVPTTLIKSISAGQQDEELIGVITDPISAAVSAGKEYIAFKFYYDTPRDYSDNDYIVGSAYMRFLQ